MRDCRSLFRHGLLALGLGMQAGCSVLSGSGVSVGKLQQSPAVQIVKITPVQAVALRTAFDASRDAAINRALESLQVRPVAPSFRFGPGDTMDIALWSVSPWVEQSASTTASNGPAAVPLGEYTVASDGAIILPYVGRVAVSGLTLQQGQELITRRFAGLRIVQQPSVTIDVKSVPQGHVMVTGSIGKPQLLPWSPAGMTLADAITQSFGDGNGSLAQNSDLAMNAAAVKVTVLRGGAMPVDLPISVALERVVPLRPGDRIVVKKAPAVKVTVLGGGVKKAGVYDFGESPSLAQVLAQASGLDGNAADDHAVFVMRPRQNERPTLYDFAWNHVQGLVASQDFEVENGDLVYVAEAPIVPVQRVVSILFELALPAEVASGGL
ncbi:MAG TPA: polysaccharide biosynthesis/export family protein [Rhodopila sp.]|nr:polysaccharide biosynthesis/export family protein [Rhodopila sp.]